MNYFGKIFTAAAALVLCCTNIFAQEQNPADTAASAKPAFPEDAPILRQDGAQKLYYIRDVNIHGVQYLNPDILKSSAGLIPGDSIYLPSNFIANAISRLWSQRFFSDVKIGAEIEGDSLDLEVFLKERPRVNNWDFEGISKGKKKDLLEKLKLKRGSELSDYVIDKNQKLIKAYWSEKGFRNTEVSTRITNDTLRPQMVNVTFLIDRKHKVKIGKINFTGNEQFKDKRLRRTFKKTHQKSINFFRGTKLNESDYENDKDLLIDFYNSKGYRNATIVSDSIYPISDKRLAIDLDISEGNKYYIRNVSWVGNSVYETDDLQRMFGVNKGDTYDKKSMHKRLGIGKETDPEAMSVSSLYQNKGYLMSQIEPAETIIGPDSIDIEVKVFEGKQFTINEVGITGNQRVDDEVIRRELYTRPGELYDRSLLMQTIRTLGSLGHFNPEAIMPDIKPVSNELVNVNWPLEEQASDQFNIAGGWGSGNVRRFGGHHAQQPLDQELLQEGRMAPLSDGPEPAAVAVGADQRHLLQGVRPEFHRPVAGRQEAQFVHHIGPLLRAEQRLLRMAEEYAVLPHVRSGGRSGQASQLARPLLHALRRGELRTLLAQKLEYVRHDQRRRQPALAQIRLRTQLGGPADLSAPRFGVQRIGAVHAPYSLWDGKDYKKLAELANSTDSKVADKANQERYRWVEFHKWQFKAQWFQALTKNSNLVLMLKAEMGYLGNYNKYKVSPFERFEVGGDGMSGYNIYGIDIISMRGYEDGALDPTNDYSVAYNKYTAEIRYPVILKPSSQIYVLGFLEGGNAFDSWKKFSPFKIKRSAGFGVRLYLPVVGMLGIDWGYGFDSPAGQSGKSGSQFHFVMGQQF